MMSAINLRAHCRIVVTSNDVATAHVRHDFHGIVETKRSYQFDQTLYRVDGEGSGLRDYSGRASL